MSKIGTPGKFTAPRAEAVLDAIAHGCTREAAAGVGGITRMTLYRWIEGDDTFRDEVEKAEHRAEAAFTAAVAAAVPRNWQAAAWWLERRKHLAYGRKDQVEVRIDMKAEVRRMASELGLDEDAVFDEVNAVLAGSR